MTKAHPGGRTRSGPSLVSWLLIARLQFHPMAFFAYALGWAAALEQGMEFSPVMFWVGYAVIFCLELGAVLVNEVHDQPSDRVNQNRSLFSGGSGILVQGSLTEGQVTKAALASLVAAALLGAALALGSGLHAGWKVGVYVCIGLVLGTGYTAPPLRLVSRGLGELNVAYTHSLYLLGFGYLLPSGRMLALEPLLFGLPVFFSVLSAISLAALPNVSADRSAGKGTLAVRFGPERVTVLAAAATLCSVLAVWPLGVSGLLPWNGAIWFACVSGLHGLVLLVCIFRLRRQSLYDRRINTTMQVALSHILLTVVFPLAWLWV